jgi:hypothetical protein
MEEEMIKMVFCPVGIVIGEKINGETGVLTLKSPKILEIKKGEGNMVNVNVGDLLGQPKSFEIGRDVMSYDVTDEKILTAYKEAVTGLTLVKAVNPFTRGMN